MADLRVIRRDKGFFLYFTVKYTDIDGVEKAFPLTGYTITFKMWEKNKPANLLVTGTCTPISADLGTCKYLVAANNFNHPAKDYDAKLEFTQSGVIESTLPFIIEIIDSA